MIGLNVITSAIAIVFLGMVARGFLPMIRLQLDPWMKQAFFGVGILAVAFLVRMFYWDMMQFILGPEAWPVLRDYLGGQEISAVFNVMVIWACMHLIYARFLLIPDDERPFWRVWNAWYHPCAGIICAIKRRR